MRSSNVQNPILSKLYPHLQFRRADAPSVEVSRRETRNSLELVRQRSASRDTKPSEQSQPVATVVEKKVTIVEPEPVKEDPKPESPKREPSPVKEEPKVEKVESPKPKPKPKPKARKVNAPPAVVKPPPARESILPKDGEKGFQPLHSMDQKREMYLQRLARKSIHTAEKEVTAVQDVLERNDHKVENILKEEKEVRQKLRLINYAKFFTEEKNEASSNINNVEPNEPQETTGNGGDVSSESETG